jgi:NAD-dependent deacetylase
LALAELQALGIVATVVTQNVDNLHQEAGSTGVVEFHGSLLSAACRSCRAPGGPVAPLLARGGVLPPRCAACGGPLKPSAVLFGERIPHDAARSAQAAARACDVMLVVGTSASVRPASDLPRLALQAGATVVEVNVEATGLTGSVSDLVLRGKAGVVLPQVLAAVKLLRAGGAGGGGGGGRAAVEDAVPRAALCAQQPPSRRRGGRRALPTRALQPRAGPMSGCHLV